jgi:hypothetical protein
MSHVLIAEFRRYAEEARAMAHSARNAEDKHYWTTLAERWMRCAENAQRAECTLDKPAKRRRRKSDPIKRKQEAA